MLRSLFLSFFFSCAKDLIVSYRFEIPGVISVAKQPFLRDPIGYRKNEEVSD